MSNHLLSLFWTWLVQASPWLQGLFGGAGVTLLWEGVVKPRRERHSLAHVLAEEVAFNLQLAVGQLVMFEHNPAGIPSDLKFLNKVYESLTPRIGELDTELIGDVVLFYATLDSLNARPTMWADTFERLRTIQREEHDEVSASITRAQHERELRTELDVQLRVCKRGIASCIERARTLLPRLRRAALPWWRLDYYVRRKKTLSFEQVRADVAKRADALGILGPRPEQSPPA